MRMPIEANATAGVPVEPVTPIVSLQPVYNQLESLMLLNDKNMSGLGEWVHRARESMTLEQLHKNRLVTSGLFYAFSTIGDEPSFGAYLDRLQSLPAESFQDRLLAAYRRISPEGCSMTDLEPPEDAQRRKILASADSYLAFLGEHFDNLDADLEAQAYRYVADPPAMKAVVIEHLRQMWDTHLGPEWTRVRPMLAKAVDAAQAAAVGMGRREAMKLVTGRDVPNPWWERAVKDAQRVIMAPSAHLGPYLGKFISGRDLVVIFGARLPRGAAGEVPDVSRTEILTRLDALADENRLHILRMAAETGEVRAADIMTALDISQSAASRSLTQLTATGYLVERRKDGGKCYTLDLERIEDTLGSLRRFLGPGAGSPRRPGGQ
jgi:DNA-binding transcriptional ArsR family regulator